MTGVSVLCDIPCHLGEGPTYDPSTRTLYWFDIRAARLLQRVWESGKTKVHKLPEMASGLAIVDGDRQLLVTETGLHIRDAATGKLALHAAVEAHDPSTRSNDARVHPCGALWFGTMGRGEEKGAGSIYWFFRGELRKLFDRVTIPNSICFSPDGGIAYYCDTADNVLMRIACDPATGLPRGDPAVFHDHRGGGYLDGSVVDAEGVLWNARWGAGSLDAYAPDGRLLRSVGLPARQTSCPAFAGHDAGRIVVTSAWQGLDDDARAADPDAGKTFLLDLPVAGRFEPRVLLD